MQMIDSLALHILLILFFILTIIENTIKFDFKKLQTSDIKITPKFLAFFVPLALIFALFLIVNGSKNIILLYIAFSFSILLIGHVIFLTLNSKLIFKIVAIIIGLALLLLRFSYSSIILHDIFLITSLLWIGPFFTKIKIIDHKKFIIVSILLFAYDIVFVWLSPLAQAVSINTESAGIPLSLIVGGSSIGTGDLVYGNILLALLITKKLQFLAIGLLLGSSMLLTIYAYIYKNIESFPLLVLWVPIGIFMLFIQKKLHEKNR